MDIQCQHRIHRCKGNGFAWINEKKKFLYLETPKCASSFITQIIRGDPHTRNILRKNIRQKIAGDYDYFVFGVMRDPEDRIVSIYKNFLKSGKKARIQQMSQLFGISKQQTKNLTITQFLEYILRYNDHHWNSQKKYLELGFHYPVYLYNIKNTNPLEKKLMEFGYRLPEQPINNSKKVSVNLGHPDRELLEKICSEDTEYFGKIQNNNNIHLIQ